MSPLETTVSPPIPQKTPPKPPQTGIEKSQGLHESPFKAEAAALITINTAKDQIATATGLALKEVQQISESAVTEKLVKDEMEYLQEAKASDQAKARTEDGLAAAQKRQQELEGIYESASAEKITDQINEITAKAGITSLSETTVEIPEVFRDASFAENPELRSHLLEKLRSEVNLLIKDTKKRQKLMDSLQVTSDTIVGAWSELTGTRDVQDIYRLLRFKMFTGVLQEKKSARVLLGDHGINHVFDWDTRIALDIAEEMGLTEMLKTRIDLATNIHDIGYTLPEIASQTEQGKFGADRRHGLHAAKIFRELWQKGFYKGLYQDSLSYANIHNTILHHDQVSYLNPHDSIDLAARERSCLIAADVAAVFQEHKLPGAIVTAPEVMLTALYKTKLAKENYTIIDANGERKVDQVRFNQALSQIQAEANERIQQDPNIDDEQRQEISIAISQLNPLSPDFIPGRLTTSVDTTKESGYDSTTGQIYFNFTPAIELQDLFGRGVNDQYAKLLLEFGLPKDQLAEALAKPSVDAAGGKVRINLRRDSEVIPPSSEFQAAAKEVLTRLRTQNMRYIEINQLIQTLIVSPESSSPILSKLGSPDIGEVFYHKMMLVSGDHFQKEGEPMGRDDIMRQLQTPEGRKGLEKHLYSVRAEYADKFIKGF